MKPKLIWALFAIALAGSGALNVVLLPRLFGPTEQTPPSLAEFEAPPGTIGVWIEVYLTDAATGETQLIVSQQSRSFAQQFLQLLYTCLADTTLSINFLSGTAAAPCTAGAFETDAAAGETECGITVGTSSAAESVTHSALQAQITHGVGAGQLQYGAGTINTPAVSGGQVKVTLNRVFTNGSGAGVTVNEVGLYVNISTDLACGAGTVTTGNAALGIRDLATFTVPNADTATVVYNLITNV